MSEAWATQVAQSHVAHVRSCSRLFAHPNAHLSVRTFNALTDKPSRSISAQALRLLHGQTGLHINHLMGCTRSTSRSRISQTRKRTVLADTKPTARIAIRRAAQQSLRRRSHDRITFRALQSLCNLRRTGQLSAGILRRRSNRERHNRPPSAPASPGVPEDAYLAATQSVYTTAQQYGVVNEDSSCIRDQLLSSCTNKLLVLYWSPSDRSLHHWIFLRRRRCKPLICRGDFGRRLENRLAFPDAVGIFARRKSLRRSCDSSSTTSHSFNATFIVLPLPP